MSTKTTVDISRRRDGRFTAVEAETGATGEGDTPTEALASLARALATAEETARIEEILNDSEESSTIGEFIEISRTVQERFEDEEVDEDDVTEAIEWARSQ